MTIVMLRKRFRRPVFEKVFGSVATAVVPENDLGVTNARFWPVQPPSRTSRAAQFCPLWTNGAQIGAAASREAEPGQHAVLETGHRADPIAGEGEDVEADAVADVGGG
jgi:hypothetical protein